jgi:hypothetical protein
MDASEMHAQIGYAEFRRYEVRFIYFDGSVRAARAITNQGELKAVYLASLSSLRVFFGRTAYRVEVHDLGPAKGVESGYAMDRMEW